MGGQQGISRFVGSDMLSFGRQIASGFCIFLASCTLFQPPPAVVERNYEGDSITKRVVVGRDFNLWPPLTETYEHARERLLTSISQECPHYRVLAEGTDSQNRVVTESQINVETGQSEKIPKNKTDYFLWIRYRCTP